MRESQRYNQVLQIWKFMKLTDGKAYLWTVLHQKKVFLNDKHLFYLTNKFHDKFQVISGTIY